MLPYSDRQILKFSTNILSKCEHLLRYKIFKKQNKQAVILPKTIDSESGYHSVCYKNYSAVPKELLKIFEDQVSATGKCKLY
jgi:hypothetical protein